MNQQISILDKNSLRRLVRQLKAQMTGSDKQAQSDSIFAKLEQTQFFAKAKDIAIYWSLDDEVCTHRFIEKWHRQKGVYLPVVVGNDLIFKQYTGMNDMKAGAFGISEPTGPEIGDLDKIDIVIVPGIAFDANNNRMGRGRGFYDRMLSATNAYKVGVAFDCQLFQQIPANENDIAMDMTITSHKNLAK